MDAEIDRLLRDIDNMYELRKRDANKQALEKMKMTVVPVITFLQQYKQIRHRKLDSVENVSTVDPVERSLRSFKSHLDSHGDLEALANEQTLLETLCSFYQERTYQLLTEKQLLLSRWRRFVGNAGDAQRLQQSVVDSYKSLDIELVDSMERFERLSFHCANQSKPAEQVSAKDAKHASHNGSHPTPAPDNIAHIQVSDMVIYLRWLVLQLRMNKNVDLFLERVDLIPQCDIESIVVDYQKHMSEYSMSVASKKRLPRKKDNFAHFVQMFEQLITHFQIKTPIEAEDGRWLAHRVGKFTDELFEKTKITPRADAEPKLGLGRDASQSGESLNMEMPMAGHSRSSRSEKVVSMASGEVNTSEATSPDGKGITILKADWQDLAEVHFRHVRLQNAFSTICKQQRKLDFQVRYEYDALSSENLAHFSDHLRAYARLYTDAAAPTGASSRTAQYYPKDKMQQYDMADLDVAPGTENKHLPTLNAFDLTLLVPVSEGGQLLMLKKREKAFQVARQHGQGGPDQEVTLEMIDAEIPIQMFFAPHEIQTYLQVRAVRIRELRLTLLHQLNFFRWVERRLAQDIDGLKLYDMLPVGSTTDPLRMGVKEQLSNLRSGLKEPQDFLRSEEVATSGSESRGEHHRRWINGKIYVTNDDNANLVYDVTYNDLSMVEDRLLRTITLFISKDTKGKEEKDHFFMENVRSKVQSKNDMLDAVYLSPEIDRQQMLHDVFVGEVQANEARISLLNAYMELYEHPLPIPYRKALIHNMYVLMRTSVNIDMAHQYFEESYKTQAAVFQSEEKLLVDMIAAMVTETRGMMQSYARQAATAPKAKHQNKTPISSAVSNLQHIFMHHPALQSVDFVEFFSGGLSPIPVLRYLASSTTDKVLDTLQNISSERCSMLVCSLLVMRKIAVHWERWKTTLFSLPTLPQASLFTEPFMDHYELITDVMEECYSKHVSGDVVNETRVALSNDAPTFDIDYGYRNTALQQLTSLCRIILGRQRLMLQWHQTDILRKVADHQANCLSLSRKLFLPKLDPLPFDSIEAFSASDELYSTEEPDDDDSFDNASGSKQEVTHLAVQEFEDLSHQCDFESLQTLVHIILNNRSTTEQTLKAQVVESNRLRAVVDINWAILNYHLRNLRNKEIVQEESARVQIYTKTIRRLESEAEAAVARRRLRKSMFDWYREAQCEVVLEAFHRVQVLHLVRQLENALNEDSFLYNVFTKSKSSSDWQTSSTDQNDLVYDLTGKGDRLKVWSIPTLLEVLKIPSQHTVNIGDRSENGGRSCDPFQALLHILGSQYSIYKNTIAYGDLLTESGYDHMRQVIGNLKKEVVNFGQPIHADKLRMYFALTATLQREKVSTSLLCSAYCILSSGNIEPYMELMTILRPNKPTSSPRHEPSTIELDFQALEPSEKKICRDRIVELEAFLEDIAHQTNLENYTLEHTLQAQIEHLKRTTKLIKLRLELLRTDLDNESLKTKERLETFIKSYRDNIMNDAYKYYIAQQRKKGTHIEELSASRSSQHEFENCQVLMIKQHLLYKYTGGFVRAVQHLFDLLVDERTNVLSHSGDVVSIPSTAPNLVAELLLPSADVLAKSALFTTFVNDLQLYSARSVAPLISKMRDKPKSETTATESDTDGNYTKPASPSSQRVIELEYNQYFVCSKEQFSQALITLGINVARWEQSRLEEMDKFYTGLNGKLIVALQQREKELYALQQEWRLNEQNYERDVRLGAAVKASDIFAELAVMGAELSDLKKARKVEEKIIKNRVRAEYDDLVQDLSGQIHKLKARFNEYRLTSIEEAVNLMSDVKKEELLSFLDRDYPQDSKRVATNLLAMEDRLSELRDDNNDLKQVLSKLKSMYTLKDRTSKAAVSKKMRTLIEDKRSAEEKLWESYRDSETRERVLRRNLLKCQKELVSAEAQLEMTKRSLRDEQKSRVLLQKAVNSQSHAVNDKVIEEEAPKRVEAFTRIEFERLAKANMNLEKQVVQLQSDISRLEGQLSARDWQLASKAVIAKSQSARVPSARSQSPHAQRSPENYAELYNKLLVKHQEILEENVRLKKRFGGARAVAPEQDSSSQGRTGAAASGGTTMGYSDENERFIRQSAMRNTSSTKGVGLLSEATVFVDLSEPDLVARLPEVSVSDASEPQDRLRPRRAVSLGEKSRPKAPITAGTTKSRSAQFQEEGMLAPSSQSPKRATTPSPSPRAVGDALGGGSASASPSKRTTLTPTSAYTPRERDARSPTSSPVRLAVGSFGTEANSQLSPLKVVPSAKSTSREDLGSSGGNPVRSRRNSLQQSS
ncbi:hypothetical protein RI367_007431 [Sorochytrium milnesiophthora]